MKFGVMQSTIGCKSDAERFVRAKALGFAGVELDLQIAELKQSGHPRREAIRTLREQHGVATPSFVLGEHNSGGIATWWRGADADDEIRLALQWCADLGATTLLVPFFFFNEPKGKPHRAAVAERLKPLSVFAAERNVVLAYEGVTRAEHLREMADAIASPGFGVYYDPANATWCDYDPAAEVRTLGPLIRQIHAKDASTFTGDARLGTGRVDHAAVAKALRDIRFTGWMVLETPGGIDAEVAADLSFAEHIYG